MTTPATDFVRIKQSDLDAFAAAFENVKAVLANFISVLMANQATPLADADAAGLQKALDDLASLEGPAPAGS
jgi:hypothetical protein